MGTFQSRLHFERWTLSQVAELKLRWIGAFGMATQLTADELLSLLSGGGYPPTPQKVDELTVAHIFEAFKMRKLVASEESGDEGEQVGTVAGPKPAPRQPILSTPELAHVPAGSSVTSATSSAKITDFPTPKPAGGNGAPAPDSENSNVDGDDGNPEPSGQGSIGTHSMVTQDSAAVEPEKQEDETDEMNALAFFAALQVCCRGPARRKLSSLYDFFDFNLSGMMDRDELLLLVIATWSGLLQAVGLFESELFPIDTMQAACERVADKVMELSLTFAANGPPHSNAGDDDDVGLEEEQEHEQTVRVSDVDKKRAVVSKGVFEKLVEDQLTRRQSTKTSLHDSQEDDGDAPEAAAVTGAAAAISPDMTSKEAACIARSVRAAVCACI